MRARSKAPGLLHMVSLQRYGVILISYYPVTDSRQVKLHLVAEMALSSK